MAIDVGRCVTDRMEERRIRYDDDAYLPFEVNEKYPRNVKL